MPITFPDTVTIIDEIRTAIGRNVTFYVVGSSMPCPEVGCSLDPVTDTSTNSFCAVCSGFYWIPTYSGYEAIAHITWGKSDVMNWESGGQYFEGDCRIQLKNTPELVTVVDNTEWVIVDDKTMDIRKIIRRGVKELNRILIDLIERE